MVVHGDRCIRRPWAGCLEADTRGDGWTVEVPSEADKTAAARPVRVTLAGQTPVEQGGLAIARTVVPKVGNGPVSLSLLVHDDYAGATAGYQFAVVRANGVEVWSRDTSGGPLEAERMTVPIDQPAGKRGELILEFGIAIRTAVTDFPVVVTFSDVALSRRGKGSCAAPSTRPPAPPPAKPRPPALPPKLTTDLQDSEALVGVAAVDVTPDYPVRLSGFGGRREESEGVTHKMWVKALAIGDDPKSGAMLVTVDNLGFPTGCRSRSPSDCRRSSASIRGG